MSPASTAGQRTTTPALYRKLRPRPNGPSRDEVKSNQRARLQGATIEAIAARGFEATSVAELCRLAGVSKRTFYEQFDNKQTCFLSTYDRIMECTIARISAARPLHEGWEAGLQAVLAALAQGVVDMPKAAHLALLEALPAGPATLARRDSARADTEWLLTSSFEESVHDVTLPPAVATGIVCGVERVMRSCLRDGREEQIEMLASELAEWARPYGSAALADLPALVSATGDPSSAPLTSRPRARHGSGHTRIVRAAAEITADDGYEELTAAKIARRAGVPESAFWHSYESTEECFLDALDRVCLEALLAAVRAARTAEDPLLGMHRGLVALLECVASDPVLRSVAFVEVLTAGASAVESSERFVDRLLDLLSESLPPSRATPGPALEASAGAIWGLVSRHAAQGDDLRALAHDVSYLALAPLVGPESAVRTLSRSSEQRPAAG
jgi:AcrR family transcriptional regulator